MLEALAQLARERPNKPIEFLADYLEEHNTEGKNGEPAWSPEQAEKEEKERAAASSDKVRN